MKQRAVNFAPPAASCDEGMQRPAPQTLSPFLLLCAVHLCLTAISWRLGYTRFELLHSLKDLPPSLALTAVVYLLFPSNARSNKEAAGNASKHVQDGPASQVLSRQLSALSLQQSLCSSSSSRAISGVRGPRQGGWAPVRRLLRRLLSTPSVAMHQQEGALLQDRRKGPARNSVDCIMPPPPTDSDGHATLPAKAASRCASLGSSPTTQGAPLPMQRWQPDMSRIASGQDLQAMEAAGGMEAGRREASKEGTLGQVGKQLGGCASLALTSTTGTGAVECLGFEATDPLMRPDISVAVPEVQLLQLGALLGEASAQAALREKQQLGLNCPAGPGPSTFLGPTDDAAQYAQGWEPLIEEHRPGLHYWAWRRYLRKGLFMYKSKTVFEGGMTAPQLAAFNFDWRFKQASDEGCACLHPMLPPGCSVGGGSGRSDPGTGASLFLAAAATCPDPAGALDSPARAAASAGGSSQAAAAGAEARASEEGEGAEGRRLERVLSNSSTSSTGSVGARGMPVAAAVRSLEEELEARTFSQSCYLYSRTRFPPPMASRQYIYARRVWLKTDDGGCYVVSRAAFDHPCPPPFSGRAVNVEDMVSGYVIRSTQGIYDRSAPAAEIVSVYFEDSRVSPRIVNLTVKKALWPIVQKMNEALRMYGSCTGAAAEQGASKLARAAAAVCVRSDHALARHMRVLQRYGTGGGGSGNGSGAVGKPGSGNSSSEGSSGATAAAAAAVAAAEAAAFEEEALILRAFDAGTLLPRQSRGGGRLLPALYKAYLKACAVVGGTARGLLYSARLLLRLQLAAHRASIHSLRALVLSPRYAALCAWLQQLAASGGTGVGTAGAAIDAPHALKQGPPSPGGSSTSTSSSGSSWGTRLLAWGWLRGRGGAGARPGLSSHPLQVQSLKSLRKSFGSHPLRATSIDPLRMSLDAGERSGGGEDSEENSGDASRRGKEASGGAGLVQQRRPGGRPIGRRLIAKGATLALRAAALPLMHRALRAYASNEGGSGLGAGSGGGRQRPQQRAVQQGMLEEEEAEAVEQRAKRRAQWLLAVAKSRNARGSSRGGGIGNSRSGWAGVEEAVTMQQGERGLASGRYSAGGSSVYEGGAASQQQQQQNQPFTTPPRAPLPPSSMKPGSSARSLRAGAGAGGTAEAQGGERTGWGSSAKGAQDHPKQQQQQQQQHARSSLHVVHSFPTLPHSPEGPRDRQMPPEGGWGWLDGPEGEAGDDERETVRRARTFGSYRRSSSLQFGGSGQWPSMVVDGVPMSPEPLLSQRFSSRSNSGRGTHEAVEGAAVGPSLGSFSRGARAELSKEGELGKGWKGMQSSSRQGGSKGGTPVKQKLTLSEIGMLHGAW